MTSAKLLAIETSVLHNDLSLAINLLTELANTSKTRFKNEIFLQAASLQRSKEDRRKGILSSELLNVEERRLTSALLDLISDLRNELKCVEYRLLKPVDHVGIRSRSNICPIEGRTHIFISHSHEDNYWLKQLKTMFRPAVISSRISIWDNTQIQAGDNKLEEIQNAINKTRLAVLLVSPHFLSSQFIVNNELPPLLHAAERGLINITWVYVSACMYELTQVVKYQAAHDTSRPLESMSPFDANSAIKHICEQIIGYNGMVQN